ncbi:MAG TPA: bifunctional riboflavin kinase/FAD synthetase [Methyloceanibacter sp.]|jgi:riboflavin kinase/FMN adenylyltransferase|nr:bifunctional riboflavin kinase/FAD synthetase [Methyloceanibacter sp.]
MEIVRFHRDVPDKLKGAALAIGNFDGVHRGHQKVLGEAIAIAKREGRRSGAVVFEPHPREFFAPQTPFFRLTPLPVKLELLEALGLDRTFVIAFDADLAALSADAFATEIVAKALGASHVVVGHDFSYGKGRTGTTEELTILGRDLGFGVDVVAPVGEDGAIFSSSRIREHLRRGEVSDAAEQLGYWWRVRGQVGAGAGRGKGLGFPTLNLPLAEGQDVRHGIYAMRVDCGAGRHHAAGYVGIRPTFGAGEPVLEAYLLDFAGDLYGKEVDVEFIAFLRPDATFATPETLAAQMREDTDRVRAVLAKIDGADPIARFPLARALAKPAQAP